MTRAGVGALFAVLALGTSCHLAPAKVWNLEQVHTPDGRPSRRGQVRSDFGYVLSSLSAGTNYGGAEHQAKAAKDERIEDPLGTCLENVVELGRCLRDERVAAIQAATFAWLAVDCTYLLSRERCALELGELASVLDLQAPPPLPEGEPLDAEAVSAALEELVAATREVVAAPDLAGRALENARERVLALPLGRQGAIRMLRATNALLERRERGAVFAPLRALRLDLARRVTAMALGEALEDPQGRVRAAALEASLRAFPGERPELLRRAMVDPMQEVAERSEVSLRALQFLARYGLPPAPEGMPIEVYERTWNGLLVEVLRLRVDGSHSVAACEALAKITGEPATLRPEVWMARWRAHSSAEPVRPSGPEKTKTAPASAEGPPPTW